MTYFYLWNDQYDNNMVQIGNKSKSGTWICFGQIHIDGVWEVFGDNASQAIKEMDHKSDPLRVRQTNPSVS